MMAISSNSQKQFLSLFLIISEVPRESWLLRVRTCWIFISISGVQCHSVLAARKWDLWILEAEFQPLKSRRCTSATFSLAWSLSGLIGSLFFSHVADFTLSSDGFWRLFSRPFATFSHHSVFLLNILQSTIRLVEGAVLLVNWYSIGFWWEDGRVSMHAVNAVLSNRSTTSTSDLLFLWEERPIRLEFSQDSHMLTFSNYHDVG